MTVCPWCNARGVVNTHRTHYECGSVEGSHPTDLSLYIVHRSLECKLAEAIVLATLPRKEVKHAKA
jgi:hypothetical protein